MSDESSSTDSNQETLRNNMVIAIQDKATETDNDDKKVNETTLTHNSATTISDNDSEPLSDNTDLFKNDDLIKDKESIESPKNQEVLSQVLDSHQRIHLHYSHV